MNTEMRGREPCLGRFIELGVLESNRERVDARIVQGHVEYPTVVESNPPLKKSPTGTSATIRIRTERWSRLSSSSTISSVVRALSANGQPEGLGFRTRFA